MAAPDAPMGPIRATDQLLAAAFHGGPADAALLAAGAVGSPRDRWLAAVVHGACGRYAAACALLEPLTRRREASDATVASLACSTLASHRRQLGGHQAARRWDSAALRVLARGGGAVKATFRAPNALKVAFTEPQRDGIGPAGALVDALLGLAADALGVGRLAEAHRLVARAEDVIRTGEEWRARVRHAWVTAELALAAGEPAAARDPAERALEVAREHGATRHEVKSAIVLAVALITARDERGRSEQLLRTALETATKHGWDSLTWPAAFAAAEFDQQLLDCGRSVLYGVLRRSDPEARVLAHNSPWVPKVARARDADIRGKEFEKKATRSCQGSAESVR